MQSEENKKPSLFKRLSKRRGWIIAFVILLLIIGIRAVFSLGNESEELTEITVGRGIIQITAPGSGKIVPQKEQNLDFGGPGTVSIIHFKKGDFVKAGEVIAEIDTTTYNADLLNAQGALQAANANYTKVKNGLDIDIQNLNQSISEIDTLIAQSNLDTTEVTANNSVANASLNVQIARENESLANQNADRIIEEADQADDLARANENVAAATSSASEDASEEQRKLTEIQYEGQIDSVNSSENVSELQTQQSQLTYSDAQATADNSQLSAAQNLEKALVSQEISRLQTEQTIANKQNDLSALGGQILQAQSSIQRANYNLSRSKIIAPFDGTILDIPFETGEYYPGPSTNNSISFGNLNSLIAEVEINELDILDIQVGQNVLIDLEASGSETLNGKISTIYPQPIQDAGSDVISYLADVTIELGDITIYPGLSLDVDVVTEEKTDILIIPFIAINQEDGKYFVDKKIGEEVEQVEIEIGIQSATEVEVLSGLAVGDTIVY